VWDNAATTRKTRRESDGRKNSQRKKERKGKRERKNGGRVRRGEK